MRKFTLIALLAVLLVQSFDASADDDRRRRRRRGGRSNTSWDLALNLGNLASLTPTVFVGYNLAEKSTVGLSVGYIASPYTSTTYDSNGFPNTSVGFNSGILLAGEYRYYFSPNKGNDKWFAGAYVRMRSFSTPDDAYADFDSNGDIVPYGKKSTLVAPGVMGGYLYQFEGGFQLTAFIGTGFAVVNNTSYTIELEDSFGQSNLVETLNSFDFRGGLCIGWRF